MFIFIWVIKYLFTLQYDCMVLLTGSSVRCASIYLLDFKRDHINVKRQDAAKLAAKT